MTTLSIILIIYIIISQLWLVVFANAKRSRTRKTWFIISTYLLIPVAFSILAIQELLDDAKDRKPMNGESNAEK
jgi:uncharacterized membrane protein YsdA (DUF1294 family)